ncbi:MAG: Ig-like domain-containing protein, partial [Balneolales bacterium]
TAEGSDNVRITISDGDNNTEEETVPVTDGDYGTDFDVSGLVDGELTIEVVGIAAGDNESGPADISVTKDTSVPALAVDDQTTNDTTPLITGTSDQAEGTEVTVTVDDEEYTAEVDADGNWSMEVTDELNDGEYVTEASITDEAGNTTADTATITIDTVDPVLTVNDLITNDTTPTITGTSDQAEGTEVTVTVDGQDYTVEVDANGDWSALVTEQLADGDYTVESSITDDVGNTTTETATITIDTENPLLTITDQITNNATPTITGTSDQPEGSEVTVTVNEQDYIAEVDSDGNWAITITTALDDGEYAIEASVTDEAGNTTIAPADVTIDTNEPALTVNDLTTNDTTPTITGTSDQPEGTEVTVTVDDEEYTAEVDADGNWAINITTTLDDGKYIVEVTITDDAGNTTTDTADLIIDTTEPVLTVTDQTTNNTTPMITGTSDQAEGTEVMVTVDDGDYTAEVDSEGNWSALVTEQLADSEYSVEGSIIDEAGNTTMETGELIIDTTEPALTATDQTTNNTTPTITGTSDQLGGIVGVTIDEQTYTGMVAENGTWSVEVTEELNDSEYMAEATITDEASNTTTDTATITVDTEEPLLSVNDQITKGATPTITGTSDQAEGAEVTVTVNGEDYSAEVDADGNWSVEVTEELNDGEFTTEATITDEAGNTTTESADLIINTTNPVINAIALAENTEEDAEYVEFEVTFSQKIDGFNLDEFLLTMTGNAQGNLSGFSGEGNIYTVSIDSIDGLGSLRLDFVYDDNSGIVDLAGNSIKQGFTGGDIHTVSSIGNIEMANSTVEVNPSTLSVKQAVTVTINLRDANKNPVSGLTYSEFALKFNEADAKTVEDSFEEIEAGVYAVDVTNENVEVVTITTTVFDVELDNQPEVTFTAGNADAFVIVSGDKQTQPTLSTLEDSLVVGISDQFGNPVEGERIVFTLETSPEFSWGSSFSRDTVLSNSSGLGTTAFRLGDEGGEYQIAAYAVEYPNLDTLVFTASANATRPDPSVIDTVNTVVFNGDMNTFMFAEPSETLNDLQSFAAEIWVLPNELAENYVLFDKEGDNDADKQFKIWGEDNKIFARINFENGSSTTLSADNIFETEAQEKQLAMKGSESIELLNSIEEKYKWTHLTFSVNDDEKRADLYKNGYRIDAVNFEGDVNTGNAELEMGRGYNGEIHEVRVWNAAINRSQVQSQMTQILTGTEDNLVFYHTFDDNGNTASDITGNANNLHLGEDVERQFSIRGIPNIEMSENDEYIMTFKGLDEYGNKLKSHITRLPSNGKLYQIKTGGTERGDEITSIPAELTDIENRALYVPNPYYNGTDELVFLLEDIYGNDASAPRQILIHEVHHTPDLNFASLAVEHRFISFDQRDTLSINLNDYVNDPDLENDPAKMSWGAKVLTDQLNPKITSETAANEKESNNVSDSISETERSIRETDTAKLQVHSVNETSDNPEFSYGTNGDNSPGQYTLTQQNAETGQKDSLIISINNNTKVATLTSTRNFDAENLPVLFTVTDPTDLSDTDTLFVTVHPVYDPPTRFAQLFPIEGDSIFVKETGNKQITFDWEPSISEEGKSIHYTFSLWNDKGEQESYSSISDTMLTLNMNKTMLEFDNSYTWLVEASDGIDTTQSMNQKHFHVVKEMPMIYSLLPNYPNPFNPETTITYYVPVESDVRITIYDILGREVQQLVNQNGHQGGHFETVWDARSLASGTYIYRMEAASVNGEHQFVNTKKMLLVK